MEKMKVYLDTNIIWGWFEKNVRNVKENKPLEITSIMNYLSTRNFELIVSYLTRTEIYRFLKSEHKAKDGICIDLWDGFKKQFKIEELEFTSFNVNLEDLANISLKIDLGKKTIINIIHIQIAKMSDLIFLSGDKTIVERLKWYYEKLIDYPSLRKLVA